MKDSGCQNILTPGHSLWLSAAAMMLVPGSKSAAEITNSAVCCVFTVNAVDLFVNVCVAQQCCLLSEFLTEVDQYLHFHWQEMTSVKVNEPDHHTTIPPLTQVQRSAGSWGSLWSSVTEGHFKWLMYSFEHLCGMSGMCECLGAKMFWF